ncbi:MAG: hypothetical protein CL927_17175 [Deltaproteobacteria bacterium]|nr:hypothetical protein [Deltaproteobacteria bacterium]
MKQPARESFFQDSRDNVDLLLIIDDSPSMLEETDSVAAANESLLASLLLLEVDLRVRAVTTSREVLLDWTPADSITQLDDLTAPLEAGLEGDRFEAGLDVAVESATDVRDEAVLHVVILSDEDDGSQRSVTEAIDALTRSAPGGLRLHAVTGDLPAGCARNGVAADPAPRYRAAAAATNGQGQSICSPSLADDLEGLTAGFTGLQRSFPLTSIPDEDSLLVWVEDASIAPAAQHAWRWMPADNALWFDGFGVPPPKARIDVEYNVARPEAGAGIARLPDTGSLR